MLFNSYIFVLFFLPLALCGYYGLNHFKKYQLAKTFLVLMSFWFYGYFNPSYILIILSSIVVNYLLGGQLLASVSKGKSKILLTIGLVFNIGLLFYFKYFDFAIENTNALFGAEFLLKNIVLPLGISFFTFQQLSYVIDSYHKKVPKYNFLDYALFVTFFPQLVAGPIVLHSEMVPQFADITKKKLDYENFSKGLFAFASGMGKKVLVADTLAMIVTWGYGDISTLNSTDAILVMLAYTFQIYFDFSGYCDIATGIGYMFNVKIPMNFNSPYKACTILEFWKRWHLTLTRFFTTYIYIPLGGSRRGKLLTYRNVMIVFLISGFWHGASWTFVVWGLLHGIASVLTRQFSRQIACIPRWFSWICTFTFINITWVIFRAVSLADAGEMLSVIFSGDFGAVSTELIDSASTSLEWLIMTRVSSALGMDSLFIAPIFLLILLSALCMKNTNERVGSFRPSILTMFVTAILLVWTVTSFAGVSTFIYFDF